MQGPRRSFPGVGQAFLLLALVWIVILLVAVFMEVVVRSGGDDAMPPSLLILVGNSIAFLGVTALGWGLARAPFREVFPFGSVPGGIWIPLVAATLGGTLLVAETDALLRLLPLPQELRDLLAEVERSMIDMARRDPVLTAVALVVVAPLTEELFFRGLLLRGFLHRYSSTAAILLSAFFFALAHITPNQLLTAWVGGIFLGWLRVRSGSLWPPVVAHALVNAQAAATLPFLDPERTAAPGSDLLPWWLVGIALALLILGLRGLHQDLPRRVPALPEEQVAL